MSFPVAGNLFHHAVEMYLKADLSEEYSSDELKSRFSHNLCRLWNEWKLKIGDNSLDPYDLVVLKLDSFEQIRYLEGRKGTKLITGVVAIDKQNPKLGPLSERTMPHYIIELPTMDSLVNMIIDKRNLNREYLAASLNQEALQWLLKENPGWNLN